jgi:O-antigen/teichoic acid export membrane protein
MWFGLAGMLGMIWQHVDTILISLLSNMTQVGLYTPAVNYIGIGDMAVVALTSAFFPIICKAVHERKISKKEYFKYLGYFAVAGLVAVGITYAFGGQVMVFAQLRRFYRFYQRSYNRICHQSADYPNVSAVGCN